MSGIGIVSVFFNLTKEVPQVENPLFNFLDDATASIDLSTLFPIDVSLKSYIRGYVGTTTVPNCERGVCWYFLGDV